MEARRNLNKLVSRLRGKDDHGDLEEFFGKEIDIKSP